MESHLYCSKKVARCLGIGLLAALAIDALAVEETVRDEQQNSPAGTAVSPDEEQTDEITWLDVAEETVGRRADELAQRIDNFYGEPVDDFSRAHSRLRLTVGGTYDDVDGADYRIKIRGKVDLPMIDQRLSILFEGDEGEPFGGQRFGDDDDDDRAGVQFNVSESGSHRFDLNTNVNSSLDLRAGVRYRYDRTFSDRFDMKYVQDVAYDTNKKAFTRGRPYLNYLTSEDAMLRGLGQWEYGEESADLEWKVGGVWVFKLEEAKGLAPFIYAVGQTATKDLNHYGLGIRYRTNIYKDFLFMEVNPGYLWKKEDVFAKRKGTWGIGLYFEMHFEADEEAPYGGRLGILPDSGSRSSAQSDAAP